MFNITLLATLSVHLKRLCVYCGGTSSYVVHEVHSNAGMYCISLRFWTVIDTVLQCAGAIGYFAVIL